MPVFKALSREPAMNTDKGMRNGFTDEPQELRGLPDEKGDSGRAEAQAPEQHGPHTKALATNGLFRVTTQRF